MRHEHSAGGVVVRRFQGAWQIAVIQPRGRPGVRALPKGHIDGRETAEEAALREVREETGLRASLDERLGEVEYSFRTPTGRIHKVVTFFLLRWESGSPMPQEAEVDLAEWVLLEDAVDVLTYPGERDLALRASEVLARRATLPPAAGA